MPTRTWWIRLFLVGRQRLCLGSTLDLQVPPRKQASHASLMAVNGIPGAYKGALPFVFSSVDSLRSITEGRGQSSKCCTQLGNGDGMCSMTAYCPCLIDRAKGHSPKRQMLSRARRAMETAAVGVTERKAKASRALNAPLLRSAPRQSSGAFSRDRAVRELLAIVTLFHQNITPYSLTTFAWETERRERS